MDTPRIEIVNSPTLPQPPPILHTSPETTDHRPVIGITIGDAAGVGPEIIHEALDSGLVPGYARYRVIGDATGITAGQPNRESARRGWEAMKESVALLKSGEIQGVVTGPINKAAMYELGFHCPGQTEFYAEAFGVKDFTMCLTGPHLTVALATIHVPLREVSGQLTTEGIVRTGRLLHQFCRQRGHTYPRIAVAGLNPHAGEQGKIGTEDVEIIRPAVEELNRTHPGVFEGPSSPDVVFYHAYRRDYHAVLCMYHDQGLIPLKMVDFREGVNVTLGLPFPRTSPDHGTAFEIAGRGIARPDSMIAAISLAAQLARRAAGA